MLPDMYSHEKHRPSFYIRRACFEHSNARQHSLCSRSSWQNSVLVIPHTPISALFVPCGLIFQVNKFIANRETEKRHRKGRGADHALYVLYPLLWGRTHCLGCLRDDRNILGTWQFVIIERREMEKDWVKLIYISYYYFFIFSELSFSQAFTHFCSLFSLWCSSVIQPSLCILCKMTHYMWPHRMHKLINKQFINRWVV